MTEWVSYRKQSRIDYGTNQTIDRSALQLGRYCASPTPLRRCLEATPRLFNSEIGISSGMKLAGWQSNGCTGQTLRCAASSPK